MAGFPSIPFSWKVGLVVFGLLSLVAGIVGGVAYVYDQGKTAGRNEMKLAYSTEAAESLKAAQKEILDAFKESKQYEEEINKTPVSEIRPSDPLIRRHYRMRR